MRQASMQSAKSGHQGPLSRQLSQTQQSQKTDGAHSAAVSRSVSMQETSNSAQHARQVSGKSTQSRQVSGKSAACHEATPAQSRQVSGTSAACHEATAQSRQVSGKSAAYHEATPAHSRQASVAATYSRQASGAKTGLQQLPENEPVFTLTGSKLRLR